MGYPCVTPRQPFNRRPKYPLALVTMISRSQYVQRSRSVMSLTPYAARISRHLYQSRASYAFWRSKNTPKRTASLMAISCCSRLSSRSEVPFPWPAQKLCITSCKLIADVIWRFRRMVTDFHITSNRPIYLKSPLAPLGIRTTFYHVLSSASVSSWNSAYTMATILCQLVASGMSSPVESINHWRRCSTHII